VLKFHTGIVCCEACCRFVLLPRLQTIHVASHEWISPCWNKMALHQLVLNAVQDYNLHPNRRLSEFKLPSNFFEQCKVYLKTSPPPCGTASRFELPFECFVQYNYYKEPRGQEFNEDLMRVPAGIEEVEGWQHAIRSLQRYCLNLLLAPKRKDFHSIKVSRKCALQNAIM